jgi:TRAP-type C4-dicarboxylate transport system permease small subunit
MIEKVIKNLNRILIFFGGISLVVMIVLTNANILSRLFWLPIRGTFELMGFMGAVVTAFALGYTQRRRGHISVDVLVNTFSEKTRQVLNALNNTVCLFFFALVTWQVAKTATILRNTGEVTETLRIIYYPFTYGVAVGFFVLSLVFLADLIRIIRPGKEDAS